MTQAQLDTVFNSLKTVEKRMTVLLEKQKEDKQTITELTEINSLLREKCKLLEDQCELLKNNQLPRVITVEDKRWEKDFITAVEKLETRDPINLQYLNIPHSKGRWLSLHDLNGVCAYECHNCDYEIDAGSPFICSCDKA